VERKVIIKDALVRRKTPEILILDRRIPWKEALMELDTNAEVLYTVYPTDKGTFMVQAVPMTISADMPVGTKLGFPQLPDSIDKIEILKKSFPDTSKINAQRFLVKETMLITCFDSGAHYIPPFYFKEQAALSNDSLKTEGINLFVKVPAVDLKRGPADIKKPFGAPIIFKEVAPWILGIILAAAIIFLIIYAIAKRRKNQPIFQRPEKPKLPAHVIALQELDQLKNDQLWQHEKVKEYYTRLTDIIRIYIEDRFAFPAMEQTTQEILSAFKERKNTLDETALKDLKEILELADLVKFAKLTPLPNDNQLVLTDAYQFVERTKPEEKPEASRPTNNHQSEIKKEKELVDLNKKEENNRL
jgi:hypothetical protein